jgi:multiple sugar transport system permease protein
MSTAPVAPVDPFAAGGSAGPAKPSSDRSSARRALPTAAWWAVCLCLAVIFLYPLYIMVVQSLKTPTEAAVAPPTFFPHHFSLHSFAALADSATGIQFTQSLVNSILVSVGATIATVVLSTLAGYGFAKLRFRGSNALFFVCLATFMIPFQAILTPLFLVLLKLHLVNSLWGLGAVYTTFQLPFGLFLMRNSFAAIPDEMEEAAQLDGCGVLRSLWRVMLPVAVPGVITTALLTFFACWNELFAAIVLITDQSKFTLPVSLTELASGNLGSIDWGLLQAGVAVTVVPCLIIYLLLQKYYVGGLLGGALK